MTGMQAIREALRRLARRTGESNPDVPPSVASPVRRFAIYPYLAGVCFPLAMWVQNLSEEPRLVDVGVIFAISCAVVLISDFSLRRLRWAAAPHSVLLTLVVVGFFAYGHASQWCADFGAMDRHVAPLWAILFLFLTSVCWHLRDSRFLDTTARFLRTTAGFLLALQLAGAARYASASWRESAEGRALPKTQSTHGSDDFGADADYPDIYYIILDAYARDDVLQELYHFDNSPFIEAIKAKGFYVVDQARANYAQTRLSLASSMDMNYLPAIAENADYDAHHPTFRRLRKSGAAVQCLRKKGYRYRYVGSRHYPSNDAADEEFYYGGTNGDFVLTFIATTALEIVRDALRIGDWFDDDWEFHEFQFDHIPHVPESTPSFTFAHVCSPHHPYLYDRNGRLPQVVHREESTPKDYLEQLRYLNQEVLQLVDEIDRVSQGKAVIILQADHGSDFQGMPTRPSATQLAERMSIFHAVKAPPEVQRRLYSTMTPVNTFRLVFAGLFGDTLPRLPDRSFYSSYDTPFRFVTY